MISLRQPFTEMLPGPLQKVAPVYLLIGQMMQPDRYIGGQVHETFHAFQAETMRARFDDAETAYKSSDAYWQLDPQMNEAWKEEIEVLYAADYAEEDGEARSLARQFLDLRSQRRSQFLHREELARFEQRFEWLEGMGKYMELNIQRAAEAAPNYQPAPGMQNVDSFKRYAGAPAFFKQEMNQMKSQATREGETRFYYTGNAQALLLDRFMPGWKQRMGEPGVWIEDLLDEALRANGG